MSSSIVLAILAASLGAGGVALLRRAWAGGGARFWVPGWTAALASLGLWARTISADEGAALGIVVIVLAAMTLLGINAASGDRKRHPLRAARDASDIAHGGQSAYRTVLAALVIGPGTGLAALSLATAAYALLEAAGAEITAGLTAVFFLFPLAWAGLAVLAAMEKRPMVRAGGVLGAALLPALAVTLTN